MRKLQCIKRHNLFKKSAVQTSC